MIKLELLWVSDVETFLLPFYNLENILAMLKIKLSNTERHKGKYIQRKMIFPRITLDHILSLYWKAALSSFYSSLLELSIFSVHLQLSLRCFPFFPTLITYSAFCTASSCHILSSFPKWTQGNLIFPRHLYRHTAVAPDQSRWATDVGATIMLWSQAKRHMRRAAEYTYKGDSKSGQHYG